MPDLTDTDIKWYVQSAALHGSLMMRDYDRQHWERPVFVYSEATGFGSVLVDLSKNVVAVAQGSESTLPREMIPRGNWHN